MLKISKLGLDKYLQRDFILEILEKESLENDKLFKSQNWLLRDPVKRYITYTLYENIIFNQNKSLKVLDIGGGVSALTRIYKNNVNYKLVDILALDNENNLTKGLKEVLVKKDWYEINIKNYDLIIANDLFPNVDQRLEEFINKYKAKTKKIILSLTWYENNFYKTKRVDADEIIFCKAWNFENIILILEKFKKNILNYNSKLFDLKEESLYKNGRHIFIVEMHF